MFRHTRRTAPAALLAVVGLALAGCGGDGDDASGSSEELGEGVAAAVDGTEIPQSRVDDLFDRAAATPQIAPELEGEQGDQLEPVLRAEILTNLITNEILITAAEEEHGVEVTQDEIDAALAETAEAAGGDEQLDARLEESGLTRDDLVDLQLRRAVALREVQAELGGGEAPAEGEAGAPAEGEAEAPAEGEAEAPAEGEQPADAGAQALQEWAQGAVAEADVTVADEYGTWDPETGAVNPPGSTEPGEGAVDPVPDAVPEPLPGEGEAPADPAAPPAEGEAPADPAAPAE